MKFKHSADNMELYQLVYYSRNTIYGDDDTYLTNMKRILAGARCNNKLRNITGFLLSDRSWFFQVLEGDKQALSTTLNRIYSDKRHTGLTIIQTQSIVTRSFDNWTMGCSVKTPEKYTIFSRHGVGVQLDPRKLSAETVVSLAYDLAEHEKKTRHLIGSPTNTLNTDGLLNTDSLPTHL
jgi:Sensors of blue-light using FAD